MPKKNIGLTITKWLILTLLIFYSVWIAIWARHQADALACSAIKINVEHSQQNDTIIKRGILSELEKYPHKIIGTPAHLINTQDIENYLSSLSNFEDVECLMTANGELSVNVIPMTPVMRVFAGDKSFYVNRAGKQISTNAEFFVDMPVVTGKFTKNFRPVEVLPAIRFIQNDPELNNLVSMVKADSPRDILLVPRITGHIINFGDTNNLAEKRDALLLFYRKVTPYKGWNYYDTISVKFRGQVVATRADKSRLNVAELDYTEDIDIDEATLPGGDSPNDSTPAKPARKTPESPGTEAPANP